MALRSERVTPFEESRETLTTPGGTPYEKVLLNFAGQRALAYAPATTTPRTHTALVLMCHGYVDRYTWIDPTATTTHGVAAAMSHVDQGWIVVSHDLHRNNWGNDDAISDLMDCYQWAASIWWIDDVILQGFSMGGMTTYNALGARVLPDVTGAVTVNGVVDIRTNWLDEAYRVYGGMNVDQLGEYMIGHDPARDDPDRWAGVPIFMSSSPNDTVCPTPVQAQVFYDRATTPDLIEFRTHTSGHLAQASFMVPEVTAWLTALVPPYESGQTPTGTPVPNWPDDPPPVGSGVALTDGTPVVLATTDGTIVSAAPTA